MDNIIDELIVLLTAALGSTYKKYFYGKNIAPEQAIFPFIEVVPVHTGVESKGTGNCRENEFSIQINIKDTVKANYTANTNKSEFTSMKSLVKRMEERESDSTFKAATVMGVLVNNLKISNKATIMGNWDIDYDDFTLDGSSIIIGSVTFTVRLLTPNP
jgi:hypothetical protein